ncbi:IS630 transposase-related protein [Neochlamydia sp. S13]|uniref:IS630 transposase-related protein n=1 Tax=Neochlamydia sp. S13 TaxID=1353976 RepID=UPI0034CFC9D4
MLRNVSYIENGGSMATASEVFGVTARTLTNWIKRKKRKRSRDIKGFLDNRRYGLLDTSCMDSVC